MSEFWDSDSGLWNLDTGLWNVDSRFLDRRRCRILAPKLWLPNPAVPIVFRRYSREIHQFLRFSAMWSSKSAVRSFPKGTPARCDERRPSHRRRRHYLKGNTLAHELALDGDVPAFAVRRCLQFLKFQQFLKYTISEIVYF